KDHHPEELLFVKPRLKPPLSRAGFITLSVIMAIFTGPAIVLNATVIIVSLMHKQLRQPLNYALVNMAVADLGTAMTGGVLSVINNAQGYFSLGRTGCVMEGFAVSLFGITSLCTVALIAVERMFVVCKPLGPVSFDLKHAAGGVALSWLWSLIWNLPPLFGWGRYELEGVGTSCAPDWHNRDPKNVSYILSYFVNLNIFCITIRSFAYIVLQISIFHYTVSQVSRMACIEGGAAAKAEMTVARMVVLMVLTFLISWMPYASLALLVVYNPDVEIHPLVGTVPVYLAKSSTVYNPIIYIYLNKQFRRYAVPFLLCGRQTWVEEEVSETQTTIEPATNKVSPS
uniref:Parapinopsin b n=1 Tax=Myripristis murdjan TaxID=586833 RepID=A0A667Y0T3_9TELE